jgi:hypothetical protein
VEISHRISQKYFKMQRYFKDMKTSSQSSKMLYNRKPFALEILEFFDVRALESHPGNRMIGSIIFLSRVDNDSVRAED